MIHSKNVTKEVIEKAKEIGSIEIEFDLYNLSEEIKVNNLLKDWNKPKYPTYKKFTFTKLYTLR